MTPRPVSPNTLDIAARLISWTQNDSDRTAHRSDCIEAAGLLTAIVLLMNSSEWSDDATSAPKLRLLISDIAVLLSNAGFEIRVSDGQPADEGAE